ncbi:MAG: cupin domain-containing protein [Albidovulum sp.]
MKLHTALIAAAMVLAPVAGFAGSCPAGKEGVDVRAPVDLMAVGVTDEVLAMLPLGDTSLKLDDRVMRVRRLTIEPGGIVPWHSHADRPALIMTTKGVINEYASTCAAPIEHKAGEVGTELPATSHWWKNLSGETVELLSFDILHDESDTNM